MTHHIDTAITLVSTTVAGAVGWVSSKWAAVWVADANGYDLNGLGQSLAGSGGVIIVGIIVVQFLVRDRKTQTTKLDKLEDERNAMTRELMNVVSRNTTAFESVQAQFETVQSQNQQIVNAMERQASAVNNAIGRLTP